MAQHLTKELADAGFDEVVQAIRLIDRSYRRGLLDKDERNHLTRDALESGFRRFLRKHRLYLRIREKNFAQFQKEYAAYPAEGEPAVPGDAAWLCVDPEETCEASPGDRLLVLYLMHCFQLPPEYYTPFPEALARSEETMLAFHHGCMVFGVRFVCTDDGGLLADADPVGKTFWLYSDRGLGAVLTVKEAWREADRGGTGYTGEFLAEGTIEGYTAEVRTGRPDVLIHIRNGRIDRLSYYSSAQDNKARQSFPLWQEYCRWMDASRKRSAAICNAAVDALTGK